MKNLLYNPFEKYSEKQLLIVGILGNILLIFLSYQFNTKFIGNLKMVPLNTIQLKNVIFQHSIILMNTTILLFGIGKYLNSKTRFIDIFNTCLISRIVFFTIPLMNYNNKMFEITKNGKLLLATSNPAITVTNDVSILLFFSIIALISAVWFFILLYKGFKTSTNAKDSKSTILFITTFIISEILSQIVILSLF